MEVNRGQSGPSGSLRKTRRNRCAFTCNPSDGRRPAECACARARIRASAHENAPDSVTTTPPVCGKKRPVKNARSDALFFCLENGQPGRPRSERPGPSTFQFLRRKESPGPSTFQLPGIVCAASGDTGKKKAGAPRPGTPPFLFPFLPFFLPFFCPGPLSPAGSGPWITPGL